MKPGRKTILRVLLLTSIVPYLLCSGCSRMVLDERFHDGRLANWTVVDDPDTLDGPSSWRVEQDGRLHQRSNIWGRRGDFLNRWYGTSLVAGDAGWKDYTITLDTEAGDDDGFGVLFRFQDADHFYRLLFVEDGFNGGPVTRLDKRDGADYTELAVARKGFRTGVPMQLEVRVVGDSIAATVDGRTLFEVKDTAYRRGKVGLFCYAQSDQAFDNVKVRTQ